MLTSAAIKPSFVQLFTPKLMTVLREGYRASDLKADALAGLTVAIVALPLSMAIAIASGVTPDRGLYTSIVGGFIISAFGGSRFQIGGPAGAFIVLVAGTVQKYGVDGLLIATFLSGLILLAVGLLRLGTFIKYIPYPVTIGFTSGIAIIIFASEIKDLLGLTLHGPEPGPLVAKLETLGAALPTINPAAVAVAAVAIGIIVALRKLRPTWPAFLIATAVTAIAAWVLHLPVETLGSRFGGIPRSLPMPHLPSVNAGRIVELLPSALAFALLGGIESLLSAVVADSMTGRRHRSNAELVAQGAANIGSALFGGICATGTIARTATNVRAGARGPFAGMFHALFVLLFMLIAAPLARYIPLAALAAILAVVCWNMAEKHEFATLVRASRGDALVVLTTFLLVIFRDLPTGIVAGFALGTLLFMHRMSQSVAVRASRPVVGEDMPDAANDGAEPYTRAATTDPDIVLYRISGAFFFGSAASVSAALDRIGVHPKAYVVDFTDVPFIDSTAAATMAGFVRTARRHGAAVHLFGVDAATKANLEIHGVATPDVDYNESLEDAMRAARLERSGQAAA
ncbi:SulP family inorganic anion transporter [Sphingomonas oryzagri]